MEFSVFGGIEFDEMTAVSHILAGINKKGSEIVWTDGDMILTEDDSAFAALVKAFDFIGLDFATGDKDVERNEPYYINFGW